MLSKAHDLRCRFENVNIYEWKQNLGLNQHASRLFSRLAKEFSEVIIVEDDVSLAPDGFEFLYTNCGSHQAVAASAYLSHSHSGLDSKLYRETFFPQQWGVALRFEILEEYCRLIKDKKLNKRLLREHFHSSLREHFSYVKIELLVYWWYNHFYFCLEHGSWPDALIQYCVIISGKNYRVPVSSLASDMASIGDRRSMNLRTSNATKLHCSKEGLSIKGKTYICGLCETRNSKIEEISIREIIGGSRHRRKLSKTSSGLLQ